MSASMLGGICGGVNARPTTRLALRRMETRKGSPRGKRAFQRDFRMARRIFHFGADSRKAARHVLWNRPWQSDAMRKRSMALHTPDGARKDRRGNGDPKGAFQFRSPTRFVTV